MSSRKRPASVEANGRAYTLRRRLLKLILIPLFVSLLVAGGISFVAAIYETGEIYDSQLVLLAEVLHSLALQEEDRDEEYHAISRYGGILSGHSEQVFSYRIWKGNRLVLASPNARSFQAAAGVPGLSNQSLGGRSWRVFVLNDSKNRILVETANAQNQRNEILGEILLMVFVPLLLVVPVVAMLAWYGIVRGLRPIGALSALIGRRDPQNLSPVTSAEIPHDSIPGEIAPLIRALNDLMVRVRTVLEMEKNFTDHAAHELRTPLATIKVQAQVALRATDRQEKQQLLEELVRGVDRASHLVSQLLLMARVQSRQGPLAPQDLGAAVRAVMDELDKYARSRGTRLVARLARGVMIQASEELLGVLIRNLVDNAIKYSPRSSIVHIRVFCRDGQAIFQTENPGRGIPEDRCEAVFDRFFRLPGSPETGCGLGLALVRQIGRIHDAEVILDRPDSSTSTRFRVIFPHRKSRP